MSGVRHAAGTMPALAFLTPGWPPRRCANGIVSSTDRIRRALCGRGCRVFIRAAGDGRTCDDRDGIALGGHAAANGLASRVLRKVARRSWEEEFARLIASGVRRHPSAVLSFTGPDRGVYRDDGSKVVIAEYLAERLPESIRSRVSWFGERPGDELEALRRRASVTVVPSRYETIGNTAVEALAMGCAVVASAAGGLAEIVRDGETILLARPGDPRDLAAKVLTLLADPDLPMAIRCLVPLGSSVTHDLGFYDGVSGAFRNLIVWGVRYQIGRVYLRDAESLPGLLLCLRAHGGAGARRCCIRSPGGDGMLIRPIDTEALRSRVRVAEPFPFFCIDGFLDPAQAAEIAAAFPTFAQAGRFGQRFDAVNERHKVQVTDADAFPAPIRRLHDELSGATWLNLLGDVMGIPDLLADPQLRGGGIHETGPRGHLDVRIDFNFIEDRHLYRRRNIPVYFNDGWQPEWGGHIELWDRDVKTCRHALMPSFNRCVSFETSDSRA